MGVWTGIKQSWLLGVLLKLMKLNYQETFAPVAKFNTIKVLFSIAANKDWPLHQLDVQNAFLNGDLEEEV